MIHHNTKIMVGAVFGRWTVKARLPNGKAVCLCSCGVEKEVFLSNVTSGKSKSCGCHRAEVLRELYGKHLASKTPTYSSWQHMMDRCYNENNDHYSNYGGRGITVDERWHDYNNFLEDMGERPEKRSIDRIDNNLGYSKDNCKWSTQKEQTANTRQNVLLEYKGAVVPLAYVCKDTGVSRTTLEHRLEKGLTLDEAITHKPYKRYR